jgi:predicted nucleotidyltransferase
MFVWPDAADLPFNLEHHTILVTLRGSKSYGTDTPESDTDYNGIVVAPSAIRDSVFDHFEQYNWKRGDGQRVSPVIGAAEAAEEGQFYSLKKFFLLATACNPNVIEALFVRKQDMVHLTLAGAYLIKNRRLFLSQRAAYTFSGYAMSQLNRIETHKRWIDSPPKAPPNRIDFNLPEDKIISGEQLGAIEKLVEQYRLNMAPWLLDADNAHKEAFYDGLREIITIASDSSWLDIQADIGTNIAINRLGIDTNFYEMVLNEKRYGQARTHWQQYQSWIKNRNPARADLESRYGYDAKHAMHLVRLLRMGKELMQTGELNVYRDDREELKLIRNGAWSFDSLINWAKTEAKEVENLARTGNSPLPKTPNKPEIEALYHKILEMRN